MELVFSRKPQNMTSGNINAGPSAMDTLMLGEMAAMKNPMEMATFAHSTMKPRIAKNGAAS